jgi:hypothetical protein
MLDSELRDRAQQYADRNKRTVNFDDELGSGNDGAVWVMAGPTAIKVFWRDDTFERELAAYLRLRERKVTKIKHFKIPLLIDFDEELMVIEMQIVTPPFLLDFGKAYVDFRPEYSEDALACWEEQYRELWGEERWKIVRKLMANLTLVGIYYQDPTPRNIHFGSEE